MTLESVKPDPEKPFPKVGVGMVAFSSDSRYIATRNDNMPCAAWIWDVATLSQIVLLKQISAIRTMVWHPTRQLLAIGTVPFLFVRFFFFVFFWDWFFGPVDAREICVGPCVVAAAYAAIIGKARYTGVRWPICISSRVAPWCVAVAVWFGVNVRGGTVPPSGFQHGPAASRPDA